VVEELCMQVPQEQALNTKVQHIEQF